MLQLSYLIAGNPVANDGYTTIMLKGVPSELDTETVYPSESTDDPHCYGVKLFSDAIGYSYHLSPSKVRSYRSQRDGALDIYLYVPAGHVITLDGKHISPKDVLDSIVEAFVDAFMSVSDGVYTFNSPPDDGYDCHRDVITSVIDKYSLEPAPRPNVICSGASTGMVICGSDAVVKGYLDYPYYREFEPYERIFFILDGTHKPYTLYPGEPVKLEPTMTRNDDSVPDPPHISEIENDDTDPNTREWISSIPLWVISGSAGLALGILIGWLIWGNPFII